MKAIKVKSVSSQLKRINTKVSLTSKETSSEVPTPKDFDSFIPWVCLQFQVPRIVTVERLNREDYRPRYKKLSLNNTKSKLKEHEKKLENAEHEAKKYNTDSIASINTDTKNAITLTTYYNTKGHIVEVAFINCPCNINRKVIRAINLCLPFHPLFYKLTIKGGGLTQSVLFEINKLLPYSNITDVCLDDNYIAEGNYHIILEKETQLQNLSLRRCKINDEMCKNLVYKLEYGEPASSNLLTLDLTSNQITDVGAQALGRMLKKNRKLLHLCLADNKITDTGAFHILNNLVSFSLSDDDVIDLRYRYMKYCFKKINTYRQCEKEIINRLREEEEKENRALIRRLTEIPKYGDKENKLHIRRLTEVSKQPDKNFTARMRRLTDISKYRSSRKLKKTVTSLYFKDRDIIEKAEKMTKEIVGDFVDIFDNQSVRYKSGQMYTLGNLKLCSLNLAYNNLSYLSVRKVYEILKYQKELCKPAQCNGLLRIVLDGNNIPKACEELRAIECYLDTAITDNISVSELSRSASTLKSHRKLPRK